MEFMALGIPVEASGCGHLLRGSGRRFGSNGPWGWICPDIQLLGLCMGLGIDKVSMEGLALSVLCVIGRPAVLDQFKVEVFSVQDDIGQESAVFAPFLALKFQGYRFAGKSFAGIVRSLFSQKGVPGFVRVDRFGCVYIQEADSFAFSLIINIKGVAVHHPHHLVRVGKTGQYQGKQQEKYNQRFFFYCQQIREVVTASVFSMGSV